MDAETCAKLTTPDEEGRVFWRAGPHTGKPSPHFVINHDSFFAGVVDISQNYATATCTLQDWDNLTLLFQRVGQAGLECCANPHDDSKQDKNKLWTPINPVENGIAVNIGDMLARWSDHRVHSNLHRVRSKLQ
jgi:hypothetical protein